jgi:hypothetical protein
VSLRFAFGRVLPTALALVLVAAGATACGGSSSSGSGAGANEGSSTPDSSQGASAAEWSQSFCTDAQKWRTSLQKAAATLKRGQSSKASANAALNGAKSATTLFAQQLSTLGPPPGGQQAVQQLKLYGQRLRYDNQNLQGEWSTPAGNAQALALDRDREGDVDHDGEAAPASRRLHQAASPELEAATGVREQRHVYDRVRKDLNPSTTVS